MDTQQQEVFDLLRQQVNEHKLILYMKGSPDMPQCGFSAQVVSALMDCNLPFAHVDVLANPQIRTHLPQFADWPTFPQLWVNGELIGGCDIIMEMHQSNELQPLLAEAVGAIDSN